MFIVNDACILYYSGWASFFLPPDIGGNSERSQFVTKTSSSCSLTLWPRGCFWEAPRCVGRNFPVMERLIASTTSALVVMRDTKDMERCGARFTARGPGECYAGLSVLTEM